MISVDIWLIYINIFNIFLSVHLLLISLPAVQTAAVFASTRFCPISPSLSESPPLMPMLPLTSSLFLKYVSPACVLFFSPRLEVRGMRLKDRFLTHGGLALWSRKHKWCGCLSVPLCCCSLPLLYSSLRCTLCPCHSLLFASSLSFAERLEAEASVTVSMGIDFSDSTQAANFQLWWDNLTSKRVLFFSLDLCFYVLFFSSQCLARYLTNYFLFFFSFFGLFSFSFCSPWGETAGTVDISSLGSDN